MLLPTVVVVDSEGSLIQSPHHHLTVYIVRAFTESHGILFDTIQFSVINLSVKAKVGVVNVTPGVNNLTTIGLDDRRL